ncbi:hypothetical protein BKA56DRAFT_63254 [Ilyonectria sp. MPI-CAGE-AT-0026]|nr:hypothetical protein BKA56DRAFT_63254 [Ilyonectria sp. MPI-CAGE-AT-0026]
MEMEEDAKEPVRCSARVQGLATTRFGARQAPVGQLRLPPLGQWEADTHTLLPPPSSIHTSHRSQPGPQDPPSSILHLSSSVIRHHASSQPLDKPTQGRVIVTNQLINPKSFPPRASTSAHPATPTLRYFPTVISHVSFITSTKPQRKLQTPPLHHSTYMPRTKPRCSGYSSCCCPSDTPLIKSSQYHTLQFDSARWTPRPSHLVFPREPSCKGESGKLVPHMHLSKP